MHMLNTKRLASASSRLVRKLSHIASSECANVPWKEIQIPVPWGHIAAKEWGTVGKEPILGIHGWLDNCGTFDKLAPLLRLPETHLVAIDLPGHGLSSPKPPGMMYRLCDWIVDVRRVIRFLGWKEYSFIGHSMGANIAVLYSAVYSSDVKKLVALDTVKPYVNNNDTLTSRIVKEIDELFYYEARVTRPPPDITMKRAVEMVADAMSQSISTESAEILLKRGAKVLDGDKVVFNRDPRLKSWSVPSLGMDQLVAFAENIRCQFMCIRASDSAFFKHQLNPVMVENIIAKYKQGVKSFELVEVEGTHHVHLNNPERVAPHINRFINSNFDYAANTLNRKIIQ